MFVQWLLAMLVLVGPLPATICTCPAHAHGHHSHHDAGHHHDHGDGHCCCHDRTPLDSLPTSAAEVLCDLDIPTLAWVVVSDTDECPIGYKFVPYRFARSVPLYITFQTLLN